MKAKMGRPFYKYDKEAHANIIESIGRNAPYEVAAWSARISEQTLYEWIKRGKQDITDGNRTDFAQLVEDIFKAEGDKIKNHLDVIEEGGSGWRGRLAILERRWRKFFGADAGIIQDLLEIITKLREDMTNLKDNQGKGFLNGRKSEGKESSEENGDEEA